MFEATDVKLKLLFIPTTDVGLLEQQVQQAVAIKEKRKRAAEFNQIAHVLRGLKLLPRASAVTALAWGMSRSGEKGLLVSYYELPTQIRGRVLPLAEAA